jgi:hypothetical protein
MGRNMALRIAIIAIVTAIAPAADAIAPATRPAFNVRNYGAVGDGISDDTAANTISGSTITGFKTPILIH